MYTARVMENAEEPAYAVSSLGSMVCLGTVKGNDWHPKSMFL